MAMHKMQQLGLPLVLIGAGLPILPALSGDMAFTVPLFDEFMKRSVPGMQSNCTSDK
jgi:hypothetical protein